MSILSNTALAFSMSADAFAASVSKGVGMKKPRVKEAVKIGLVFGTVETITPILGWLLGVAAGGFIAAVDHWVAFGILAAVGGKMIYESLHPAHAETPKPRGKKMKRLVLTAFGTSIDAMAVGVTLALLDANIIMVALMIGGATFLMTTLGVMTGHYIGLRAGRIAELLGGLTLILIGTKILLTHLGYWA